VLVWGLALEKAEHAGMERDPGIRQKGQEGVGDPPAGTSAFSGGFYPSPYLSKD
jgi:hypothetical protein